jgi:branched-chain amino acid transport system ATP-binding protein
MLAVTNVSAGYGGFQALFGATLEVRAGEAVAVIGPNGAGKTTLLRVISKLISPTSGTLTFDGQSLAPLPAHAVVARGIAHVPENRRLFARLTTEENLRMGAFTARATYARRLDEVYALFPRLQERRHQPAGTMSGGEQQMCAIARALMSRPRLLLIDELSLGLAPTIVEQLLETVREINAQGTTIVLVEQNANYALDVSSRGYVLETGHIALTDTSENLRNDERVQAAYLGA